MATLEGCSQPTGTSSSPAASCSSRGLHCHPLHPCYSSYIPNMYLYIPKLMPVLLRYSPKNKLPRSPASPEAEPRSWSSSQRYPRSRSLWPRPLSCRVLCNSQLQHIAKKHCFFFPKKGEKSQKDPASNNPQALMLRHKRPNEPGACQKCGTRRL